MPIDRYGNYVPQSTTEVFNTDVSQFNTDIQNILRENAQSQGLTAQEYLLSRGGVNPVTGTYGDSFNPQLDLTDAEYKAAIAGKTGIAQGQALNAARIAKEQSVLAASGTAYKAPDGTYYASAADARQAGAMGGAGVGTGTGTPADAAEAEKLRRAGQSAYDILLAEFNQYGLGALVEPLKNLIQSGPSSAELTLALRATDAYQKRFAANKARINAGLSALNEAEYIRLEDQYQNVMRNYGLPASYYTKDTTGRQEGFEKLIGFDVSATELEDRVLTAQNRVINAAPEVTTALRQFYPDITNGDILAYTLDPSKGLSEIKRKVTAAEIGGAAIGAGLGTAVNRAEELARYGVTAESAQKGYSAIGGGLERGRQLSSIYQQPDYNQAVAEEELFNLPGQTEAQQKRKKVIGLEKATFGGQTGVSSGALSQNRAGSY